MSIGFSKIGATSSSVMVAGAIDAIAARNQGIYDGTVAVGEAKYWRRGLPFPSFRPGLPFCATVSPMMSSGTSFVRELSPPFLRR